VIGGDIGGGGCSGFLTLEGSFTFIVICGDRAAVGDAIISFLVV